jgi:hypothetical protein
VDGYYLRVAILQCQIRGECFTAILQPLSKWGFRYKIRFYPENGYADEYYFKVAILQCQIRGECFTAILQPPLKLLYCLFVAFLLFSIIQLYPVVFKNDLKKYYI